MIAYHKRTCYNARYHKRGVPIERVKDMILALDIGNTNITIGVYEGEHLRLVSRMATDRARMEDQYAIEMRDILDIYGVNIQEVQGSIISSVVPPLTPYIVRAVTRLTGTHPICVGPDTRTGLSIRLPNPETLGADLIVGCVAAAELYGGPCIVLDMGTATTLSVLDAEKNMIGGCIIPGVGISLDALASRTAQLPGISLEAPEKVIGDTTVSCMQSGVVYGTACMIEGLCGRIEEELGNICRIVATGGLAREIVQHCRREIVYCDNLLLEGLKILYERNRS